MAVPTLSDILREHGTHFKVLEDLMTIDTPARVEGKFLTASVSIRLEFFSEPIS